MKRAMAMIALTGIVVAAWFSGLAWSGRLPSFVTHRFNPLVMRLGLAGGRRSPWGILEHTGRVSGRPHRTPLSLLGGAEGSHVFVRLSYGPDVHWVHNVRRAGHCRMQLHGTVLELDEPAVVPAVEDSMLPSVVRTALAAAGRSYLRLHVVERRPGTLDDLASDRRPIRLTGVGHAAYADGGIREGRSAARDRPREARGTSR